MWSIFSQTRFKVGILSECSINFCQVSHQDYPDFYYPVELQVQKCFRQILLNEKEKLSSPAFTLRHTVQGKALYPEFQMMRCEY